MNIPDHLLYTPEHEWLDPTTNTSYPLSLYGVHSDG
jgi:glycine cleavage system H lipoate-binding protein